MVIFLSYSNVTIAINILYFLIFLLGFCADGKLLTCNKPDHISDDKFRCVKDEKFDAAVNALHSFLLKNLKERHGRYLCKDSFLVSNIPFSESMNKQDMFGFYQDYVNESESSHPIFENADHFDSTDVF